VQPSPAGIAALALFVLVLGFWVPARVRRRSGLAAARVHDRFSGGLRVLPVTSGNAVRPSAPQPAGRPAALAAPLSGLVTMGASAGARDVVVVSARTSVSRSGDDGHHGRSAVSSRSGVDAGVGTGDETDAGRRAYLARRARRARRRMVLTVLLLLATAGAWAAVPVTTLLWYGALAPTGLLVIVLVLGRIASANSRRADARWAVGARARVVEPAEPKRVRFGTSGAARGGPGEAERAPVGRESGVGLRRTEVATDAAAVARDSVRRDVAAVAPGPAPAVVPAASPGVASVDGSADSPVAVTFESLLATPVATEPLRGSPGPAGQDGTRMPPPVPLPTYVTKPAAPRWEPIPLAGSESGTGGAGGWSSGSWRAQEPDGTVSEELTSWSLRATQDAALAEATEQSATAQLAGTVQPAPGSAAVDGASRPQSLGLPLDQILARRRAV
jgi:hypothetical protein